MPQFRSTRDTSPAVTLSEALVAGLAPDGGLYVPTVFPTLEASAFRGLAGVNEVATALLRPFFEGDVLSADLGLICDEALAIDVPLRAVDADTRIMELFHGPSAAFKDFGARFLASCLSRLQRDEDQALTILVATSGDTGGAVAAAFSGKPGVEVVVLYPEGRVSDRQAHQLSCWGGNVTTLAVQSDFDACQELVKAAFQDPVCNAKKRLSSANSINIGRLLPQMAYHAQASLQFRGATFLIPTGNLGNALAARWARRVGMPLGDIVLCTNANDTLVRYQQSGVLDPHATVPTLANAMDVSRPSNLERLLSLDGPLWDGMHAVSVDDNTVRTVLAEAPERYGAPVCPHTAIALHARAGFPGRAIVAATAHPAKFDTVVEPLIGAAIPLPPTLAGLLERPRHEQRMPATLEALRGALGC